MLLSAHAEQFNASYMPYFSEDVLFLVNIFEVKCSCQATVYIPEDILDSFTDISLWYIIKKYEVLGHIGLHFILENSNNTKI